MSMTRTGKGPIFMILIYQGDTECPAYPIPGHLIPCRAPSSAFQYGLISSPVAGFPPVTLQVLLELFPD
jgi:hypothetical protein